MLLHPYSHSIECNENEHYYPRASVFSASLKKEWTPHSYIGLIPMQSSPFHSIAVSLNSFTSLASPIALFESFVQNSFFIQLEEYPYAIQ